MSVSVAWQAGPQHCPHDGAHDDLRLLAEGCKCQAKDHGRPVLHRPQGQPPRPVPALLSDTHVEQERIKHAPLPDSTPQRMTAGLTLSLLLVCGRLQCSGARNHCDVCGKFVNGHDDGCPVLIGNAARAARRARRRLLSRL